jgi:hypothetical protein
MLKDIFKLFFKIFFSPLYKKINQFGEVINANTDLVLRVISYNSHPLNNHRTKVIYTCITNNYDDLIQHNYINFDYDYICYTDSTKLLEMESYGIWKIKPLQYTTSDAVRINRWHKIHPHILFPNYEESMYLDGDIDMRTNILFSLIQTDDVIRIPIHNDTCIYDEAVKIIKSGKDKKECVEKMIDYLRSENFPQKYGLNENCIIYRKHNDKRIIMMMNMWWELIEKFSKRDQLSLSFVLWKFNVSPYAIAFPNVRHDANFIFRGSHNLFSP